MPPLYYASLDPQEVLLARKLVASAIALLVAFYTPCCQLSMLYITQALTNARSTVLEQCPSTPEPPGTAHQLASTHLMHSTNTRTYDISIQYVELAQAPQYCLKATFVQTAVQKYIIYMMETVSPTEATSL